MERLKIVRSVVSPQSILAHLAKVCFLLVWYSYMVVLGEYAGETHQVDVNAWLAVDCPANPLSLFHCCRKHRVGP